MKSRRLVCLVVVALALTQVQPLIASTFIAMDTEQLVRASASVVEGEVLSVSSFWNPEGTIILTEAMLLVRDRHYGNSASLVKVKTFGGEVDGYLVQADGFPKFERGERVFLFLQGDHIDTDMRRVTGYQLGHYKIETRADGREWAFPTLDEGARLVTSTGAVASAPVALPLAQLREEVRMLAEQIAGDETDRPVK